MLFLLLRSAPRGSDQRAVSEHHGEVATALPRLYMSARRSIDSMFLSGSTFLHADTYILLRSSYAKSIKYLQQTSPMFCTWYQYLFWRVDGFITSERRPAATGSKSFSYRKNYPTLTPSNVSPKTFSYCKNYPTLTPSKLSPKRLVQF